MSEKKLGFGLMRLPLIDPKDDSSIDIELTSKMVDRFIEEGFTYFDTAMMYHASKSQAAIKKALVDRYPREAYTMATKLHVGFFSADEDKDDVFRGQLETIGVDYFDYYLIHDIEKGNYDEYVKRDCFNWLAEKKKAGLVKKMGFSFHSTADFLDKVLTEHPEMEFVQLQINYLDWESEKVQSRACYEVAVKHGKDIIIMEPVKGGTLANVPENVEKMFKAYNSEMSAPSWAVRFAATLPGVKRVLSGMSNLEQMEDNLSYMKDFKPLTESEIKICHTAADIINNNITIPCTGCAYCTTGCSMKIAIPRYFALYNESMNKDKDKASAEDIQAYNDIAKEYGKAGTCLACGKCEKVCPQHLDIITGLKTVADRFEV